MTLKELMLKKVQFTRQGIKYTRNKIAESTAEMNENERAFFVSIDGEYVGSIWLWDDQTITFFDKIKEEDIPVKTTANVKRCIDNVLKEG